ncbi:DUF885 domain-containing protein [Labilithrix luteola]|uniref:DUF885 domain-containing protein n=1 Tax=Labilithrix luteola TaxID=1391654 RepID=UPI0014735CF4|nr:DUF885 domain-containing protein [Labilithrix luteola]
MTRSARFSALVLVAVLGALPSLGACGGGGAHTASANTLPNASVRTSPPPKEAEKEAVVASENPDDEAIARAGKEYLELLVETSPETATGLGVHSHDAELDDRTKEGDAKIVAREEAMLARLKQRFANPRASAPAKTDLAMLVSALEVDIRHRRTQEPLARQPDLYASPLSVIFLMTARDYAPAAERARNVVARLEKIPAVVAAAKTNLQRPPRIWTEVGIDRAASAKGFLEEQRPFLIASLPNEKARVEVALASAQAAYEDYKTFLQKEVLPRSNGRFAAGREHFEFLLHNDYFLDEGADELLAMGKKVFAETNVQMNEVAKRIDRKAKGWPDVVGRLKSHHPTAEGLLEAYRVEVKRARDYLVAKDVVPFPPGDDLEVIDTPPFMRSTITAAYDQPPPFDPTTKGFFFVTPVDRSLPKNKQEEILRENDHGDLVDTAVHEAYPGHHLQLSFARRNPSLTRKIFDHAIFSEGWALYSEELMAELGYFTDEERLMQLEWTLVRAARVIIDIGLHVGELSFEGAAKMLTDEVHLERQLALSEVKRYTMTPTQPLAYLTGRQMILKMRERYREREGANYSLKKFHTELLTRATVPPSLMAREIFAN